MVAAAGGLPDQPGVHRAKGQFAAFRSCPRTWNVVQYPGNLGGGKIGVDHQAGALLDQWLVSISFEPVAEWSRATVLPDDRPVNGFASLSIPYKGCLSLVGDSDSSNLMRLQTSLFQYLEGDADLRHPDLCRVVLHPASFWKDLLKFSLGCGPDHPIVIKQNGSRTRCSLIQRKNIRQGRLLSQDSLMNGLLMPVASAPGPRMLDTPVILAVVQFRAHSLESGAVFGFYVEKRPEISLWVAARIAALAPTIKRPFGCQ